MKLSICSRILAIVPVPVMATFALLISGCGSGDTIVRVSRQNNSGTYVYFREAVLGKDREYKQGSYDQSGSKDVVTLVAKTPNAIGYSGMGYATPEVKMLKLSAKKGEEAVDPNMENAMSGDYPLARNLYIYVVGEAKGAEKHYIDWIKSEEGQAIVKKIGYVPIEPVEPPADQPVPEGDVTIKVAGSDTMVNLAQAWAETYDLKFPNVSVQVSGGGSGVGIAKLIDGTVEMANASRDMKPEELEEVTAKRGQEPTEIIVGMDALAVYVHKDNPLDSISLEELAEIYGDGGKVTNWSQLDGWPKETQASLR